MSALAKPLNHFTSAIAAHQNYFVPAEQVASVTKLDVTAIENNPAEYYLVFKLYTVSQPIKIQFATSAARNTSLTNFITANSAAIA